MIPAAERHAIFADSTNQHRIHLVSGRRLDDGLVKAAPDIGKIDGRQVFDIQQREEHRQTAPFGCIENPLAKQVPSHGRYVQFFAGHRRIVGSADQFALAITPVHGNPDQRRRSLVTPDQVPRTPQDLLDGGAVKGHIEHARLAGTKPDHVIRRIREQRIDELRITTALIAVGGKVSWRPNARI